MYLKLSLKPISKMYLKLSLNPISKIYLKFYLKFPNNYFRSKIYTEILKSCQKKENMIIIKKQKISVMYTIIILLQYELLYKKVLFQKPNSTVIIKYVIIFS